MTSRQFDILKKINDLCNINKDGKVSAPIIQKSFEITDSLFAEDILQIVRKGHIEVLPISTNWYPNYSERKEMLYFRIKASGRLFLKNNNI